MRLRRIIQGMGIGCMGACSFSAPNAMSGQILSSSALITTPPAPTLPVRHVSGGTGSAPITLPTIKGQPYSLVRTTTSVQTLADGTTITHINEESEMRDSEGRKRTEIGDPKDGQFNVRSVILDDPVARTQTFLQVRSKTASVTHLPEPTPEQQAKRDEARAQAAARRKARGVTDQPEWETLPAQTVAGVYAEGTRMTHVIAAGSLGNDRDITTVSEIWRSPELNILLNTCFDDPRTSKNTTVITDLQRTEPSPQMFEIPSDFTVTSRPEAAPSLTTPIRP